MLIQCYESVHLDPSQGFPAKRSIHAASLRWTRDDGGICERPITLSLPDGTGKQGIFYRISDRCVVLPGVFDSAKSLNG